MTQPWHLAMVRWLATLNPSQTQREYARTVTAFFKTPGVPQSLDALTFDLLLTYRGAIAMRATAHQETHPDALAPGTVNRYLGALRGFLVWASECGWLCAQLTPDHIRVALKCLSGKPRRPYQVLVEDEWPAFLDAADSPRDRALCALALATGLRAIELASLDVGDIEREWSTGDWWLILPDPKTKGQRGGRELPLDGAIVRTLLAYLSSRRRGPLFLTSWGERLNTHAIRRIVKRVATRWRVGRADESRSISTHSLRHSAAVALLLGNPATGRAPASLEHVRGWLGHKDIRTTQGYLAHIEGRKHRRPFLMVSPPAPDMSELQRQADARRAEHRREKARAAHRRWLAQWHMPVPVA